MPAGGSVLEFSICRNTTALVSLPPCLPLHPLQAPPPITVNISTYPLPHSRVQNARDWQKYSSYILRLPHLILFRRPAIRAIKVNVDVMAPVSSQSSLSGFYSQAFLHKPRVAIGMFILYFISLSYLPIKVFSLPSLAPILMPQAALYPHLIPSPALPPPPINKVNVHPLDPSLQKNPVESDIDKTHRHFLHQWSHLNPSSMALQEWILISFGSLSIVSRLVYPYSFS